MFDYAGGVEDTASAYLPLSLFASGRPALAVDAPVRRIELDPCCWVDYFPRLVSGGDQLFIEVSQGFDWHRGQRLMFGNWVDEPRLTSKVALDEPCVPEAVTAAVDHLSSHYDRTFEGLFCNYYQSGADSVAWHSDRIGRHVVDPLVAIISVGGPRLFALRDQSKESEPLRVTLHSGDVLVMGGATQHHWEHAIPKVRHAPPRISLTARAGWPVLEPGETGRFLP
jgi:alkylated DNA repair dioxygenase AlkB